MTEAVTPPNPDQSGSGQPVPDPTLMTIDALRREIAMLENLIDSKLRAAENLTIERITRIDALMERAEDMRQEQKADTRAAVEAALDAQKEATHKMENTVSEQIASLRDNFETSIRGVQSNVADLKDRMTILESVKQGVTQQKSEHRQLTTGMIAAIGLGIAFFTALIAFLSFLAGSAGGV